MKQSIGVSTLLLILLFVLPLLVITPVLHRQLAESEEPSEPLTIIPGDIDSAETVRVLDDGTVQEMTLANYLVGVVRAEMPASFEREALRAQAVAARTYTLYKIKNGGNHGDTADVCTDPKCCQAYISEEAARSNWGAKADDYEAKIEDAVYSTDGQAILYDGQPILAAFHSSSPGYTRSAGEVWLTDLPYLQSVSSPEKGDAIPNYYSRAEFTAEDFKKRVLAAYPEADLSGAMITQVIYNLLENAAKFAIPDSTLYLGVTALDGKARVMIRNFGETIPAEELPLLFERFHKSDKSRSEDKDGVGLGLYIVKTILEQHKEKINVTSENGVTTFTFSLGMDRGNAWRR